MRNRNLLWIALGVAVSCTYLTWCVGSVEFYVRATRAEGTVVDTEPHRSIAFTLPDGTRHVFVQNGNLQASVGQHVPVGYLRDAPQDTARVITFDSVFGAPLRFILGFLGFGIAPIVGVVLDERPRQCRA